jgi:hypothetical protein
MIRITAIFLLFSLIKCASYSQVKLDLEDCYNDRANIDTITNQIGEIKLIAQTYCLVFNNGNKRYTPCNLPDSLKRDMPEVMFSGIEKEIFPYERRVGTPFVLSAIKISEKNE